MRGRERVRGVAPRAYLGRPFRSPPSPEVRHKRGRVSVDSGEWTVVRHRRRKASRQGDEVVDRLRQKPDTHIHQCSSFSKHRHQFFDDQHHRIKSRAGDHHLNRLQQMRFISGGSREFCRQELSNQRAWSVSRKAQEVSRPGCGWQQQQRMVDRDRYRFEGEDRCGHEGVDESGRLVSGRNQVSRTAAMASLSGLAGEQYTWDMGANKGSELKRYVSFYFTNFPAQLSNFYLRKGFEVCGMLEDVFVAKKRNRFGEPYGFVKFSNVRDITKMTKALNAVWFGHFRVRATVAKFERNVTGEEGRQQMEKVGFSKEPVASLMKDDNHSSKRHVVLTSDEMRTNSTKPTSEKSGPGLQEGVKVGDILVKLGAQHELIVQNEGQRNGEGPTPNNLGTLAAVAQEKENRILLRKYCTKPDDVQWVHNGLVATVINGEAIPVVQNRITDAGFTDVEIIPMGADKVFVRSSEEIDSMSIVSSAKEFFKLVFSNWTRWDKVVQPYHRGAWVRLYGIPLHAWDEQFFKLCVYDCGRFLRTDNCSADRDRLDFARVLLATPQLDIINRVEKVLVDGMLVEIKIVEEWGYAMGEDTCLFEEGSATEASQSDCEEGHIDPDVCRNVDMLVDKITVGLEEAAKDVVIGRSVVESSDKHLGYTSRVGDSEGESEHTVGIPSPVCDNIEVLKVKSHGDVGDGVVEVGSALLQTEPQAGPTTRFTNGESVRDADNQVHNNRANSCPPVATRSVCSGPWSLEWLQDLDHGEAGVIFSARKRGGLLTLWDSSEVEVWSSESRDHVLWCRGRFTKSGEEFLVANVYAPCDDGAKLVLWGSLSARIQSLGRQRLCVYGDFNAVKLVDERRSSRGESRSLDHIPFNSFIDDNNLIDLPLSGRKFTWFKGDGLSMSRLDRFLLSEEWCLTWPNCTQTASLRGLSDHCSLVLSANEDDWGSRPSRMLKCWRDVPGYKGFVKDKWNSFQVDGWGGFVLKEKLRMIKTALKDWHTAHAQNLPSRIESLKARLSTLDLKGEEEALSEDEINELHGISADIHSLSRMHASISWQQSRSLWLKEGDANSKYFHSVLAGRRRGNTISVIHADGVTLEGVLPIRQAVFSHFASHFKAINMERPRVGNLHFKSYKSPGPDGVNFGFIKDFWAELRGDVMRFIAEFHRNGKLTKGLNSTFIALIPKIDSPQRLNDFRPISLVGSLYKILAKVLANRLRLVIGSVISESQTAFVKDRQILDGILIANEVVDEARKSKKELMLFKVDFEKAYDSVDWGYLDDVMGRMSFPSLWRKWIKECVCSATASVLVNGSPTDEFPLERGLRQGDPLSPFLFLLTAEGLNVLMEAAVANNVFTGYSIGERDSISVSHLQFADDTLLLGVKSWANVRALRAILVLFETMSGLKVNFHKSMLVGFNISDSWLGEAASALCCKMGKIPFFYLGLPIGGDSRRLGFWDPVLTRLKNRLSGWRSRFLSFGGRLVLLKSVLTSLPVYALSFFKAPAENRGQTVAEMFSLGWGVAGEAWQWMRQLWAWEEEMLRECQTLLLGISLQVQSSDRWQWQPDPDEGYTVRGAYQLLTSQVSATMDDADTLIWHSQVLLKVSILAWRLLRDSRWISGAAFLYAAHLACVCLGRVDRKKSSLISRLDK
ncbi:hypothetical protein TSUD_244350 [Trifolium subterraneum]|uniref:Reverse transcriptase domain-containing protein n=1 Tax=Trifolium subterraneum TaxID=3900 RepID=A0A2Z6PFR8_TRISU|nr:hypothetical protein TSUD_244350 [Trifolium subterraneum]